jgi:short-subunit dehydrogenase
VCPSFFRTNIGSSLRTTDPRLRVVMGRLLEKSELTAVDIADEIFRAVERRRFYVLPHPAGRKVWRLKRLLPRAAYARMMEKQTRLLRGRP